MFYEILKMKSFQAVATLFLFTVCMFSSVTAQGQNPAKTTTTQQQSVDEKTSETKLTAEEEALVRGSREAILSAGLSPAYFEEHFKLIKVFNAPADHRVVWKFSVNEHETVVQDAVGVSIVGKERRQSHAVSSALPTMTEIHHTISRKRAERILRACIGTFDDAYVELRRAGETGRVGLFLAASAKPKVPATAADSHGKADDKKREATSQRPSLSNATVGTAKKSSQPASQVDILKPKSGRRPPPLILGAVNLQTGKCIKGIGQVGPPRVK